MASAGNTETPERGHQRPFLIGVSGGTASGKSTVCEKIMELLGQNEVDQRQRKVVILSQDRFYKVLTPEQKARALKGQYNFDHPDAFDNDLMSRTLTKILEGQSVDVPMYDFVTHSRLPETTTVYPADVLLFEGILTFYNQEIRDMFHLKLFVDTDSDVRLSRRVLRDMKRGRELEQILTQYTTFVKPAFEEFSLPTKKYADVIIPRGVDNMVAINLIVQHIQDILNGDICKWQRGSANGRLQKRSFPETGESGGVLVPDFAPLLSVAPCGVIHFLDYYTQQAAGEHPGVHHPVFSPQRHLQVTTYHCSIKTLFPNLWFSMLGVVVLHQPGDPQMGNPCTGLCMSLTYSFLFL